MNWPVAARQLVVTAAFAAANHRLQAQAELILAAFPELIADVEQRAVCQALLLLGLAQPAAAWGCLSGYSSDEALQLRRLLLEAHPELALPPPELGSLHTFNRV